MSLQSINLVEFLLGLLFSLILPDPKEFNVWVRGTLVFSLGVVLPYVCYQDPNACMSLWPFNLFFDFFHQELQINDPYITLLFFSFFVSFLLGCFTMLYGFLHLISNQWQFFDQVHLSLPVHITGLFVSTHNKPIRKKVKAKKKKRRNLRVAIVIALWLFLMIVVFRQEIFNLGSYLFMKLNTPSTHTEPSKIVNQESSWNWIAFLDVFSISKDGQVVEEQIVETGPVVSGSPKKKTKEKPRYEDDDDNVGEFDDYDWDEDDTDTEKMQAKKKIEEKTKKKQEKELKKAAKNNDTNTRNHLAREQFLAWLKEFRKTHPMWSWLNPSERPDAYYSLWIGSWSLTVVFCFCVWKIYRIQERQDMEARKAQQPQLPHPNSKSKNRRNNKNLSTNKDTGAGISSNGNNNSNMKDSTDSLGSSNKSRAAKKKRKKLSSSDGVIHTKTPNKNYPL